jgi:F0F1-type ATP synthase assembly protein I
VTDQDKPPNAPEGPKPLPGAAAFLGMGFTAAVCVGLGVGLGLWLDHVFNTAPVLLLVGLALGVVTAALGVIQQMRTFL